jgi:phage gpG-like protein
MKIEIKIADISKLVAAIGMVADEEVRKSVADAQINVLRQISEKNFTSERMRPEPWAPLAESTAKGFSKARMKAAARRDKAAIKAGKKAEGARPLIDTGTLARSLSVQNATPIGAELVSTQGYAGYHQFGSVKRPGRPPARPFVPVTGAWGSELQPTAEAEKRMLDAADSALRAAAKRAGFKIER